MKIITKILRAGRPDRRSRFHTGTGILVPVKRWAHFLLATFSWAKLRMGSKLEVRPWLSYSAVERINALLPANANVLEVGSGQSTLWLAPRCAHLLSIESDRHWFESLHKKIATSGYNHVDLRYIWVASEMCDFREIADGSLDFALVDGGPRFEVLKMALPKVKSGGFVYVDNTDEDSISGGCRSALIAHAKQVGGSIEFFSDFSPCTPHATEGVLWISPKTWAPSGSSS